MSSPESGFVSSEIHQDQFLNTIDVFGEDEKVNLREIHSIAFDTLDLHTFCRMNLMKQKDKEQKVRGES